MIGPSALITALLYYFGWAKADAFSRFFGLDVSLFSLSTQDYTLQSIRAVFVPLAVLLIAGLVLLRGHDAVVRLIDGDPRRPLWPRLAIALAVAGGAAAILGAFMYVDDTPSDAVLVATPLTLMAGVGLLSYAVLVDGRRRETPRGPAGPPGLTVLLVSLLIAVGVVWAAAGYADVKGREEARFVLDQLHYQPGVVVYSAKRLEIGVPGVEEEALAPDSAFPFRYDGLKLLFHAKDRFFLVPESWSPKQDSTVVALRDDATMRFEFVRPAD